MHTQRYTDVQRIYVYIHLSLYNIYTHIYVYTYVYTYIHGCMDHLHKANMTALEGRCPVVAQLRHPVEVLLDLAALVYTLLRLGGL